MELSQQLQALITNQGSHPEAIAAIVAVLASMAQRPSEGQPSGAAPAADPPALREPPPPSFPVDLPTIDHHSLADVVRGMQIEGPPTAILAACWDVLVRKELHTNPKMQHELSAFWAPDGSRIRDAGEAYRWVCQESPQLAEEVTHSLHEVRSLRDSLHGATSRFSVALSKAAFLFHISRRALASSTDLETSGLNP